MKDTTGSKIASTQNKFLVIKVIVLQPLTTFLCAIFILSDAYQETLGLPSAISHHFSAGFLMGLKKLEEGSQKVIFLFWRDAFLQLDPLTQRTFFFISISSLRCKIVSFSPYSEWINQEFVATLKKLTTTGRQFGGILAAHSIATTLKYWYHGSPPGEIVSLGVLSEGKSGFFISCNILKPPRVPCTPTSASPPVYLLTWSVSCLDFHNSTTIHLFMYAFSYPFRNSAVFCMHALGTLRGIRSVLHLLESYKSTREPDT